MRREGIKVKKGGGGLGQWGKEAEGIKGQGRIRAGRKRGARDDADWSEQNETQGGSAGARKCTCSTHLTRNGSHRVKV